MPRGYENYPALRDDDEHIRNNEHTINVQRMSVWEESEGQGWEGKWFWTLPSGGSDVTTLHDGSSR